MFGKEKRKSNPNRARKFTPPKNMLHIIVSEVRFISLAINLLRMFTTTVKTEWAEPCIILQWRKILVS